MKHIAKSLGSFTVISRGCLKAWGCSQLPASNKQLLTGIFFLFFFNDNFSLCSSGQHLEDRDSVHATASGSTVPELGALSACPAQWSERRGSQSPAQVRTAGGRNMHNGRKLGTSPLQKQINNTFRFFFLAYSRTSLDKILSFPQQQRGVEAEVFSH